MYNTTIRSFIFKILFHFYVCWEWVLAGACLMGLQNDKSINLAIGQIQLTRFTKIKKKLLAATRLILSHLTLLFENENLTFLLKRQYKLQVKIPTKEYMKACRERVPLPRIGLIFSQQSFISFSYYHQLSVSFRVLVLVCSERFLSFFLIFKLLLE